MRKTLAAVCFCAFASARAHDFWIEPSTYRTAPGSVVTARLLVGEHLRGEGVPRNEAWIERFAAGVTPIAGLDGADPAGVVRLDATGTHALVYESRGQLVELPAARFERYLKEEGLEHVLKERAGRGVSGAPGRERFYRCAKALVVVGAASSRQSSSGLTLEIVPRVDPSTLRAGDRLPVTVSFRGRPLEGGLVRILPGGNSARTDRRGHATLTVPQEGPCLVKTVWMTAAVHGSGADWESWWATLGFCAYRRSS